MAQSKKDKSHKQKLLKYKKLKKMSKAPEMKPFRQVPTWQSSETFELKGDEMEALYNYFNIVAPAFTAIQQIFARGFQTGKIQFNYEYEDGTPANPDEVKAYTDKLNEYFANLKKEQYAEAAANESASILTATGERATVEDLRTEKV